MAGYLMMPALAEESISTDAASATTADAAAATTSDAAKAESAETADTAATEKKQKTSWLQKMHKPATNKITLDSLEAAQTAPNTDKVQIADGSDPAAKDPGKDPGKDPKAKPAKKGGGDVGLPERAAAFTTGVLFGTPVAILRRTHMEIMQGEHDLIGDYDTWWKKAVFVFPGLFLAVPFGGISGCGSGAMYSVRNAWKGSGDEPFGKDSFSLGDVGN
jgi:hypothetical protein